MHQNPVAVIDVGTNTFHLLLAQLHPKGTFTEIFRERRFIKLAQDGIHHIGPAPYQRALDTMRDFRQYIDQYGAENIRAFGTAALRTAANGIGLRDDILRQTGISIELISGEEEARYILNGVRLAMPFDEKPRLIMDIGGGSVEFIIANRSEVFWMQSFPVGVAILYRNFHRTEPISASETANLREFLEKQLAPLKDALEQFPVSAFVGVAGTFDVLENLLELLPLTPQSVILSLDRFPEVLHKICTSNADQRLRMDAIPRYRADMIVVALLLLEFVLGLYPFERILVSRFDLKEGMIGEFLSPELPK